jgi:hypothetical protein
MSELDVDLTVIPCSEMNENQTFLAHSLPRQRIRVSRRSRLVDIAEYLLNLVASTSVRPSRIVLYAPTETGRVSLPLCLTLDELFFITNRT